MGLFSGGKYVTLSGYGVFNQCDFSQKEREFLEEVYNKFHSIEIEWSEFDTAWTELLQDSDLPMNSLVCEICKDLGTRLRNKQGNVPPTDYRNDLHDLLTRGSREKGIDMISFCMDRNISLPVVNKILSGDQTVTLAELLPILEKLGVTLVTRPTKGIIDAVRIFEVDAFEV